MPLELLAYYLNLPLLALVVARLGGMLMFQPLLGALAVPVQARFGLVIGLALLVLPLAGQHVVLPDTLVGLAVAIGQEVLLGGLIGLVCAIAFVGLQFGGLLIAQESGLVFGQIADPNGQDELDVLSALYLQLGLVIFVLVGGHRAVLGACLDTFRTLPLPGGGAACLVPGTALILQTLTLAGEVALRVAAPTVLTLFLLNIAMGFVSRTVPQLNILTFGFSIKALVGFLMMAISLPTAGAAFIDALEDMIGGLHHLVSP